MRLLLPAQAETREESQHSHQREKDLSHTQIEGHVGITGRRVQRQGRGKQFPQTQEILAKVEEPFGQQVQLDPSFLVQSRQPEESRQPQGQGQGGQGGEHLRNQVFPKNLVSTRLPLTASR